MSSVSGRPIISFVCVAIISLCVTALTHAESVCVYQDRRGEVRQARRLQDIPEGYRRAAKCVEDIGVSAMANASDISLSGTVRRETTSTAIGRVELRWPRKVEELFGRTPQRALTEAARALSTALRRGGFPSRLGNLNLDLKMVFLDENLPEQQIPQYLINNCHPGWMVPGNVYIVAQRVASGCNGQRRSSTVADSELVRVLLHELGHVVEHELIPKRFGDSRERAEGFASWIEQYAADFSPVVERDSSKEQYRALAKVSYQQNPDRFTFTGSAPDYGRVSLYFSAIVARRGVDGLMDVYDTIGKDGLSFPEAARRRLGWDKQRLESEAKLLIDD